MATAIISHFLTNALVQTNHTGVALGNGIGRISTISSSLIANKIYSSLNSVSIKGKTIRSFADAIASAFTKHFLTSAIVSVTITGNPRPLAWGSPIPGSGTGSGKIV